MVYLLVFQVHAQTLSEYLEVAAENNPQLQASFHQYLAAVEKVPQVGALPDPQVTFGYFTKPMEMPMGKQRAEITLMQMFPWFGLLRNSKDEASQMANARYQGFLETKNQLFYQIKSTWYEMYKLEEEIRLMEENIAILKSFERLAISRFSSGNSGSTGSTTPRDMSSTQGNIQNQQGGGGMEGMGGSSTSSGNTRSSNSMNTMNGNTMSSGGSMVDVLRVQMEIKELENTIKRLEDSRKPLLTRFNKLLNRPVSETVQVVDTLVAGELPLDRLALLDSVMNNNPMVRMYDFERQAFDTQKEMARREGNPMIGVGVNYMIFSPATNGEQMQMGGENMWMPMVSVTIPLNRKKYNAMKKEAELLGNAAQFEQTAARNQLSIQWDETIRDLDDAARQIKKYQEQITLAGQALRLITTTYSAEGAGFEEVLRVQQQLISYQLNLINTIVDQNEIIARIEMLAAININ